MGEHIHYAVGISLFLVFFTMTVTTGGFAEFVGNQTLNEHNVSQEDLSVSPDIPDPEVVEVDLIDDIDQKDNLEKVNVSNLTDPDFQTDYALQLNNSSEKGIVFYQVPNSVEVVEVKSTKKGFFEFTDVTFAEYSTTSVQDFETDSIRTLRIQGESDMTLDDSTNYVGLRIDANSDDKIYDIGYKTAEDQGIFSTVLDYLSAGASSLASWIQIVTGLPSVLAWLGIAIGLIALLVIIMIITW